MTRVLHVIPQHDRSGAVAQAALVASAVGASCDMLSLRLGVDLPWRGGFDLRGWRLLDEAVRERQPDVIHSWLAADDCWTLWMLARQRRAPVVASWRDRESWPIAWWPRFVSHRVSRIVVPTVGLSEAFAAQRIDAARLTVVPDLLPELDRDSGALPNEMAALLPVDALLIVAVGRWRWSDHWRELMWAADLLKFLHLPVHLVLCGEGEDVARLERYRRQIEIVDRVHLRPIAEAAQWLDRAQVCWSLRDDPGVSPELLRAMQRGVPVVASQTGDHARLITDRHNGFLVPHGSRADLAKRALQLHEDPGLAERIAAAARKTVQDRQTHAAAVAQWQQIYASLSSGVSGAAPGGGVPPPLRM
ncbi:MAG: glycosyltransferase [Planctomycetaceae bacterium]|nr:glycosyltransferase [Planctomycetaceae bacterium]